LETSSDSTQSLIIARITVATVTGDVLDRPVTAFNLCNPA
jgi:hypothetical protein